MPKDDDVMRCTCGAWVYVGNPCGFCDKEIKNLVIKIKPKPTVKEWRWL